MSQLHTPCKLNFNAENLAEEWRRWKKSFKIYYAAAELGSKTVTTQVAILLNCAWKRVNCLFVEVCNYFLNCSKEIFNFLASNM